MTEPPGDDPAPPPAKLRTRYGELTNANSTSRIAPEAAQITSTVGRFPGVEWVVILVGGRPLCAALGEC